MATIAREFRRAAPPWKPIGQRKRDQECLQDKADGASAASLRRFGHVKDVGAGSGPSRWRKAQFGRAKPIS